jgi:hypothetical protein
MCKANWLILQEVLRKTFAILISRYYHCFLLMANLLTLKGVPIVNLSQFFCTRMYNSCIMYFLPRKVLHTRSSPSFFNSALTFASHDKFNVTTFWRKTI